MKSSTVAEKRKQIVEKTIKCKSEFRKPGSITMEEFIKKREASENNTVKTKATPSPSSLNIMDFLCAVVILGALVALVLLLDVS